jgi:hypothetical protein
MTEKDIHDCFVRYKSWLVEQSIIDACDAQGTLSKELLCKRIALVDHWFQIVTEKEALVLRLHFVNELSWKRMSDISLEKDLPGDMRALQRMQKRAIQKVTDFMAERFGDRLDDLIQFWSSNCR